MKQIIAINLYKFSNNDIYKIRSLNKTDNHTYKVLPEYTLNNKGCIVETEYYLQFTGTFEDESIEWFWLFDLCYADSMINEEIKLAGLSDALPFNFNALFEKMRNANSCKIFSIISDYEMYKKSIPIEDHIAFNLEFIGSGEDCESVIDLLGYIDNTFNLIKI